MIEEVAETKAGGPANLKKALERGAVQVQKNAQGVELYYFPEDQHWRTLANHMRRAPCHVQ